MKRIVERLLKEHLQNEMYFTQHIFDRLEDRLNMFRKEEISADDRREISQYLRNLKMLSFDPDYSFGIKIADLDINPRSPLYYKVGNRAYYRIDDFLGRDSTGNQIWVIVRNDNATTIMLRKDIQPTYKMNVDYIIDNKRQIPEFINKKLIKI